MGRVDRPKGILKTELTGKIIPFEQDSNYYFQKGNYYHQKNKLSKALLFLKKAIEIEPGNAENHYNLACLLSKTGSLAEANEIFRHILRKLDPAMTECYFLIAINHGLMEDMDGARKYLLKYLHVSPEGDMAEEAHDLLTAMDEEEVDHPAGDNEFTVQESAAIEEAISGLSTEQLRRRFEEKSFRQALQRGLYQGSDSLKEQIIRLYGKIHYHENLSHLHDYVVSPWVKERLRQIALLELKNISPAENCRIYSDGRIIEVNLCSYPLLAPTWREEWQEVLNLTFANMRSNSYYGEEFFDDAQAIWLDFVNNSYPAMPRIRKPQAWAAGLEYCLARFHFLSVTQKELAADYGVSPVSISRVYKVINDLLHIEQKAYRNMLTYLAHQERDRS